MARADQDYDVIIKGLNQAEEALNALASNAGMLDMEADTAATELKDKVGQKDIKDLKDLAEAIKNAVKPGEERVRELILEMQKRQRDFEALER